jgi:hypothetical protein
LSLIAAVAVTADAVVATGLIFFFAVQLRLSASNLKLRFIKTLACEEGSSVWLVKTSGMFSWSHERCALRHIKFNEKPYWLISVDQRQPAEPLRDIEHINAAILQEMQADAELKPAADALQLCDFVQASC